MKITRAAFLYLEPKDHDHEDDFAQCGSCELFLAGEKRCAIHGRDEEIEADDSCGFYVSGTPSDDQRIAALVTPAESGLLDEHVQCRNCEYGAERCRLYVALNRALPAMFDLDPDIETHGCCNAWTKRTPDRAQRRYGG